MNIKYEQDAKLGAKEHFAYALGGGAININLVLFTTYLLIYYTNVVGIKAGLAASVIAFSKVLDGVSDLIMGYIVDHTNAKSGKARPWLVRMMIPMIVTAIFTFYVPIGWNVKAQTIYMFVTYNLANTVCYTALLVSFNSLNGYMTTNQKSRGLNGGLVMVFNAVTTIVISTTILRLTRVFGKGDVYTQRGWTLTIIVFMIAYAIFSLVCFAVTRERTNAIGTSEAGSININKNTMEGLERKEDNITAMKSLISLFKNKYWVICIIAGIAINFMMGITGNTTVYFAQYVLNTVDLQGTLSAVLNLALVPSAILSIILMGKYGKRNLMMAGTIFTAIVSILPALNQSVGVCVIASALKGIGLGLAAAPVGSIVQDALTYGHWKNGFNNTGMGNAANSFAGKIGSSLGTIALGALLEVSGFVSGAAIQSAETSDMIRFIYIWMPAILSAICAITMHFYDLDKKYEMIESELTKGKFANRQ